jgi:tetratricopeptide (TPR) repeat protein
MSNLLVRCFALGLCVVGLAPSLGRAEEPAAAPTPAPSPTAATAQNSQAPQTDCDRLTAIAPPFATPAQLNKSKHVDWRAAAATCEAALAANPKATHLLYLSALTLDKTNNLVEAVRRYKSAADAGDAQAMSDLGILFATGRGVVKDEQRAYELIDRAALAGNPAAMGNLGTLYSRGIFVHKDYAKALEWYEKSIEAGNSFGLAQAGVMYFNGWGTERDYNAAAQYFQQAADLDDGYSLKFLAILYERGLLGKPDLEKAGALRLLASQVDPDSQNPDVPPPAATAPAHHMARTHYVIRRYRFFGCGWVWC